MSVLNTLTEPVWPFVEKWARTAVRTFKNTTYGTILGGCLHVVPASCLPVSNPVSEGWWFPNKSISVNNVLFRHHFSNSSLHLDFTNYYNQTKNFDESIKGQWWAKRLTACRSIIEHHHHHHHPLTDLLPWRQSKLDDLKESLVCMCFYEGPRVFNLKVLLVTSV